jgi:ubiquinone/menaquinone biosynthesis C-methylase UbiE
MSIEEQIAGHYTRGGLEETILQAVRQAGKDPEHLTAADLSVVDEFHVGGIEATKHLAAEMDLRPGLRLLDVGSGIGGPARYFAAEHGCKVTGIDLTEEFVQVAGSLTRLVHLDGLVEFRQASALQIPFEAETFDRAYMIHVGMNIPDKAGLCREVRRVLKSGGLFAIFDIVRATHDPIRYPVPWASNDETSFVRDAGSYRDALERAGFILTHEQSRKQFAVEFTRQTMARMAEHGPPVVGLQLLMGEKTPLLLANVQIMLQQGVIEPVELIARAA